MKKELEKFAKKIRPVYKLLNWTWYDSKKAPTEKRIVEVLIELITNLEASLKSSEISTGGLYARRDNEEGTINYGFCLEQRLW